MIQRNMRFRYLYVFIILLVTACNAVGRVEPTRITLTPTLDPAVVGMRVIPFEANGNVVVMKVGETIALRLTDDRQWQVILTEDGILEADTSRAAPGGISGFFTAKKEGKTYLSAQGNSVCSPKSEPCPTQTLAYVIFILVEP